MKKSPQIDSELVRDLCHRLWYLGGSLKGVGALLEQQSSQSSYESDELFGLGQFLKNSSEELSKIEDLIRCQGYPNLDPSSPIEEQ